MHAEPARASPAPLQLQPGSLLPPLFPILQSFSQPDPRTLWEPGRSGLSLAGRDYVWRSGRGSSGMTPSGGSAANTGKFASLREPKTVGRQEGSPESSGEIRFRRHAPQTPPRFRFTLSPLSICSFCVFALLSPRFRLALVISLCTRRTLRALNALPTVTGREVSSRLEPPPSPAQHKGSGWGQDPTSPGLC